MEGRVLNSRELAIVLEIEVTPDLLTDLARSKKIPAEKIGGRWAFKKKDVPQIRSHLLSRHEGAA